MFVYKNSNQTGTSKTKKIVNYTHNLNTSSAVLSSTAYVSSSTDNYWNSLNVLFYTSGSVKYPGETKFNHHTANFTMYDNINPQHVNKFHNRPSCSIISITQKYFGEIINQRSQLTAYTYQYYKFYLVLQCWFQTYSNLFKFFYKFIYIFALID